MSVKRYTTYFWIIPFKDQLIILIMMPVIDLDSSARSSGFVSFSHIKHFFYYLGNTTRKLT
jgi:hypothetical protein